MRSLLGNAPHQRATYWAFAAGLAAHGEAFSNHGPAVTWGPHSGHHLCLEAGHLTAPEGGDYVARRLRYISVAWDGYGGRGWVPKRTEPRFELVAKPWCRAGGYVLVLGQTPSDRAVPQNYPDILRSVVEKLGDDVVYRKHPNCGLDLSGVRTHTGTLAEALAGAAVAITYSSNSAVEAVLAGVPTICLDRGCVAWPVCGHELGEIVTPDRTEWLIEMTWRNWALDEIASGEMWAFMKEGL